MGKTKTSEDRVKDLNEVDTLIQLFVQRGEEYFKSRDTRKGYVSFDYEWSSVKRISLELTRALAKLRKTKNLSKTHSPSTNHKHESDCWAEASFHKRPNLTRVLFPFRSNKGKRHRREGNTVTRRVL